jgi:hypothetical protein
MFSIIIVENGDKSNKLECFMLASIYSLVIKRALSIEAPFSAPLWGY